MSAPRQPTLEDVAEDLPAYVPVPPIVEREERPDVVLVHTPNPHPAFGSASRVRFQDATCATSIDAVRAWFAAKGRERFVWWIGASATPRDIRERLLDAGGSPFTQEPAVEAMLLTTAPPEAPLDVRRVDTYEDFLEVGPIMWEAFGFTEEQRAAMLETRDRRWKERDLERGATYLAYDDDRPVAFAFASFTANCVILDGAGTLPDARGRGAFTALVRARWDDAVQKGTPALAVHAGEMSRSKLHRLGFRSVGTVHAIEDGSS